MCHYEKNKRFFKKAIRLLSTKEQRPSERAAKISLKFLNDEILKTLIILTIFNINEFCF